MSHPIWWEKNQLFLGRAVRSTPTAVEFTFRVSEIVISKFPSYNCKSSYDRDDRVNALDNLLKRSQFVEGKPTTELPDWMNPDETFLSGYVVKTLIVKNQVK